MKEYPLEEFFGAIAAAHEMIMEEQDLPAETPLSKHDFQHLILEALDFMCDCEDEEEVSATPIEWQLAMVSMFGNLEDVQVTISGDGSINTYEASHKDGKKATVQCPHSQVKTGEDQEKYMIQAMEQLKALL